MGNGKYCFAWKIENFSMCPQENGEYLQSPEFTAKNINESNWNLTLFPRGVDERSKNFISLYIHRRKNESQDDLNDIGIIFEAIGPRGDIVKSAEKLNLISEKGNSWGWDRFFNRELQDKKDFAEEWEDKEDVLTIRCIIFNRKQEDCVVCTKIGIVDKCLRKWETTIQYFPLQNKSRITLFDGTRVDIVVTAMDYIYLILTINREFSVPRHMSCKVSLLDRNEVRLISKKATRFVTASSDCWVFPALLSTSYLRNLKGINFIHDTYTFLFEFSIANGSYHNTLISPTDKNFPEISNVTKFLENLQDMYNNELHSDLVICVDEQTFHAHKSILAARSPVFLAMFNQDMLESRTSKVSIPDVEAEIFKHFLQYMYFAKFNELDCDIVCKLFVVADKYQVLTLKSRCADILMAALNQENVCKVLTLADKFSHAELRSFSLGYVAKHAKEILSSSNWIKLCEKNVKLASEAISNIAIDFETGPKKK